MFAPRLPPNLSSLLVLWGPRKWRTAATAGLTHLPQPYHLNRARPSRSIHPQSLLSQRVRLSRLRPPMTMIPSIGTPPMTMILSVGTPFSWPTPAPPCEGSTPNFEDEFGADCAFYEIVDQPGCPLYGDYFGGPMGTARENCCYCQMEVPSSSPTLTNQPTTATRAPTLPNSTPTIDDDFMQWFGGASSEPPCEGNTPGWVDSFGDGCWYYEMFDAPGLPGTEGGP
ncbi:hypothetical protein THAOC_20810, partial [Thalassiosira oceanica]